MFPVTISASVPTEPALTISTRQQLLDFRTAINGGTSYSGRLVVLGADIDMDGQNWTDPIGNTSARAFTGTFDGRHYTIRNLGQNATATGGLFGFAGNATIENIYMTNIRISATNQSVGGIVREQVPSTTLTINNCVIRGGSITSTNTVQGIGVGGIIFSKHAGNITNCIVEANISAPNGAGGTDWVSGIVLEVNSAITISRNYFNGNLNGFMATGIAAQLRAAGTIVENNSANGDFTGTGHAGGLSNRVFATSTVTMRWNSIQARLHASVVGGSTTHPRAAGLSALTLRDNGTAHLTATGNVVLSPSITVSGGINRTASLITERGSAGANLGTVVPTNNQHINTLIRGSATLTQNAPNSNLTSVDTSTSRDSSWFNIIQNYKDIGWTFTSTGAWVMLGNRPALRNVAFSDLNEKIREGSRIADANKDKVTTGSLAALTNRLASATTFMQAETVTASSITNEIQQINSAINDLVNTEALQTAEARAKRITSATHLNSGQWDTLQTELNLSTLYASGTDATIATRITAIDNSISALRSSIAVTLGSVTAGHHTTHSFAAIQAALSLPFSTPDQQVNYILAAQSALSGLVDIQSLQQAETQALRVVESPHGSAYLNATQWDNLSAYVNVATLYNNGSASAIAIRTGAINSTIEVLQVHIAALLAGVCPDSHTTETYAHVSALLPPNPAPTTTPAQVQYILDAQVALYNLVEICPYCKQIDCGCCPDCGEIPCVCCNECGEYPCECCTVPDCTCCKICDQHPCACPPPPTPCPECDQIDCICCKVPDCTCCEICGEHPCACPPPPTPCPECDQIDCICCKVPDCTCCEICDQHPCACLEIMKNEILKVIGEIDALVSSNGRLDFYTLESYIAYQDARAEAMNALHEIDDVAILGEFLQDLIDAIDGLTQNSVQPVPPSENQFNKTILIAGLAIAACMLFGGLLVMFSMKWRKKSKTSAAV
jgi:hypothetical protein